MLNVRIATPPWDKKRNYWADINPGIASSYIFGLKKGDKTILSPGMAFAVDGGITIPDKFGARIGDTILITQNGTECVTEYPRDEPIIKG